MKQLRSIMTYVLLALSLAVYSQDKKENENHTAALLTKCQLVIDKNNQKAALQGKIAELKKQIEISMRQWETACNEALNAEDITVAQIRHLLAQTDSIHEVELHKRLQERLKELCANNQNPVANGGEKHKSPVNDWKHENDFKAPAHKDERNSETIPPKQESKDDIGKKAKKASIDDIDSKI